MANVIENLPNSFFKFCEAEAASCADYDGIRLPFASVYDFLFMVRVNDTTTTYLDSLGFFYITGSYEVSDTIALTDIVGYFPNGYALITGTDYILYTAEPTCDVPISDPYPLNFFDTGECGTLVIAITSTREIVCIATPGIEKIRNTCFTELVRYKCADNAYGFFYEEVDTDLGKSFYNQMRLKIDITSPTPLTKKTGFELADGSFRTLGARKQKQWNVETDYFTDHIHQCLDAAIDHDELFIAVNIPSECDFTDYEFYHDQDDKYDIDWQEGPGNHLGVAKAKFKLKTNPYYSQNSNC